MSIYRFINEEVFYNKTRPSIYYKRSNIIRGFTDNFLAFILIHHFSDTRKYINQDSSGDYSCVIEITDEMNDKHICGVKYKQIDKNILKISDVSFYKK